MCHTHFQVHLVSYLNMEIILVNPNVDGSKSGNLVAEQTLREILNLLHDSGWQNKSAYRRTLNFVPLARFQQNSPQRVQLARQGD